VTRLTPCRENYKGGTADHRRRKRSGQVHGSEVQRYWVAASVLSGITVISARDCSAMGVEEIMHF
jgi:hypothetical protein